MPTPDTAVCAVIDVVDGDTIKVVCASGGSASVRLMGYDTPETFRPGCSAERRLGEKATRTLTSWLRSGGVIGLSFEGTDRYNRVLGNLLIDERPVAERMIAAGLAVPNNGERRINWCRRLAAS